MACFFRGMTYSIGTGLGTNNKPKIKENMITTILFFFLGGGRGGGLWGKAYVNTSLKSWAMRSYYKQKTNLPFRHL